MTIPTPHPGTPSPQPAAPVIPVALQQKRERIAGRMRVRYEGIQYDPNHQDAEQNSKPWLVRGPDPNGNEIDMWGSEDEIQKFFPVVVTPPQRPAEVEKEVWDALDDRSKERLAYAAEGRLAAMVFLTSALPILRAQAAEQAALAFGVPGNPNPILAPNGVFTAQMAEAQMIAEEKVNAYLDSQRAENEAALLAHNKEFDAIVAPVHRSLAEKCRREERETDKRALERMRWEDGQAANEKSARERRLTLFTCAVTFVASVVGAIVTVVLSK